MTLWSLTGDVTVDWTGAPILSTFCVVGQKFESATRDLSSQTYTHKRKRAKKLMHRWLTFAGRAHQTLKTQLNNSNYIQLSSCLTENSLSTIRHYPVRTTLLAPFSPESFSWTNRHFFSSLSRTMDPGVIAVIGTTGVGKSNLSIQLSKELDGEVINGDALQVKKKKKKKGPFDSSNNMQGNP